MRRAKASAADLPADLVEEIFLRLDDTADLLRASAACASFRRIVSDGGFLRRYRSLHRPPVLGLLSKRFCFQPAEPPRRCAQAARAVELAAGFSSSFLPANTTRTEHCWHVHDSRDGRVLLFASWSDIKHVTCLSCTNLVVYDPLQRKHVQIPPIPNGIVGVACTCMTTEQHRCCDCYCMFDPFLVPAAAAAPAKDDDDLSFQVMCTVMSLDSDVLEAFVYSSVTGKWRGVASFSNADYEPLRYLGHLVRCYAHGCFYWVCFREEDMLVLDMNEMKFSLVRVPPGTKDEAKVVVEAAAEQEGVVVLVLRENTLHLYRKAAFGGSANNDCWQWRHDDDVSITLLDSYQWLLCDADQGYALLKRIPRDEFEAWRSYPFKMGPKTNAHYFTVGLETLLVEQLCVAGFDIVSAFLYASFPPPFAPPSL